MKNIQRRAATLVDLLLFEIAVNTFNGVFGSSHGRSYSHAKMAAQESITDTQKLLFGEACCSSDNMSAAAFALSLRYRLPDVIHAIANDSQRGELLQRQRVGICIDQGRLVGVSAG